MDRDTARAIHQVLSGTYVLDADNKARKLAADIRTAELDLEAGARKLRDVHNYGNLQNKCECVVCLPLAKLDALKDQGGVK